MKYKTVGEAIQTDEGREELQMTVKEEVTRAFQESAEQIDAGVVSLFKVLSNAGIQIIEHKDELEGLLRFAEKVDSMPEDEAKAYLEELFNEVFEGQEVPESEKQEIIEQWYKKPNSITMPMTKAIERIFDGKTDLTELTGLQVATRKGEMTPIIVNAQVFVLDSDGVQMPKYLTPYDRAVFDGVCSIIEMGQTTFTSKQVYEAMAGKSTTSPQALGAVTKSIRKMMMSLITIDWTEHARLKNLPVQGSDCITTEQNMLNCISVKIRCNGQEMTGYKLLKAPDLYVYSKAVKQIASIERRFFNVPTISNTPENIILKFSLARAVEHMRLNNHWNRTIKFDTLFKDCDISDDKNNLTRKRKAVVSILDHWKKTGYIRDYEIQMKGRTFYSITLDVRKADPSKIGN